MIGLLRRGDDGLTDRQRQRMSDRYERTLGATPDAATFARARARHAASLLASPQQGADAAATALVPTVAACTDTGEAGRVAELTPASPACLICGAPAVPGDDLALCQTDGGLGPEWAGFEAAWLAGREA